MIRRAILLPFVVVPLGAQLPQTLGDVQVTATRVSVELARTPAAVTILDGAELRGRGVTTLLDALRLVPGAATVQAGSYGAVASLFLRGGENDFTKLLVDGVPMNLPGGQLNLANIPLDDVERIEVVRGPVSVQHGADAISGVIQVFTRRGAGRLHGEAEAKAGTWGNTDARAAIRGATDRWHAAASASRFASDGTYPFNNAYLNGTGSLQAGYERTGEGGVAVTLHLGDALARFPTDGGGVPDDINQRVLDRDLALGLTSHRRAGSVTFHADGWFHRLDSRLRDPQDAPGDTTGFGYSAVRDAVSDRAGGTAWLEWRGSDAMRLTGGVGVERERETQHSLTRSNFGFGIDVTEGDFRADRTTSNVNAQLLLAPRHDLDVHVGTRHDDNTAFGGFTTWRAGLVWRPLQQVRVWAAGGTGFKAPTFSELFAASAFEVGNPALRPERSRSVEAGLALSAEYGALSLTAFDQEYRDLIQYITVAPGEPTYDNLAAARSRGVEVSATWHATDAIILRGDWTRLHTEVSDTGASSSVTFAQGERLLRRPSHTLSATILARPWGTTASLAVFRVGERDDADFRDFPASRITLPSYVVVNAALAVPIAAPGQGWPGLALQVRGENLLDAEWEQAVGFPGRGRTVMAGGHLYW